jgi:hypothetical protein
MTNVAATATATAATGATGPSVVGAVKVKDALEIKGVAKEVDVSVYDVADEWDDGDEVVGEDELIDRLLKELLFPLHTREPVPDPVPRPMRMGTGLFATARWRRQMRNTERRYWRTDRNAWLLQVQALM